MWESGIEMAVVVAPAQEVLAPAATAVAAADC
jgi:hypothetical protein